MELDLLTTSVGRGLIRETYSSLLERLEFDGQIHVSVVIDPSYRVEAEEISGTIGWIESLPQRDPRIASINVRRFNHNVGLQRAVVTLLSMSRCRYALYLEDDWRCLSALRPSALVSAIEELGAGMIALTSPTAAANGTFTRTQEAVPALAAGVDLFRLCAPSWAADYLPLHPHIHDAWRWPPTYLHALMEDDEPARCPDERVRDWVRLHRARDRCPVYWTREIMFEDIGRVWQSERSIAKNISPDRQRPSMPSLPGWDATHGRSENYFGRAQKVIPGETQTFMKRRLNFPENGFPAFISSGDGPFVLDVDGNGYIDMIAGLGALSLGHRHPAVEQAIDAQRALGLIHSLPTLVEIEAAEAVARLEPSTPAVRFFKNGSDAAAAAVRLARAVTGRDIFLSCGYHGANDMFMTGTPGVPIAYSDLQLKVDILSADGPNSVAQALEQHDGEVAALIVALPYHELVTAELFADLQIRLKAAGALLIMDEIVTGFRLRGGSATSQYNIKPDIICWGKSLAAGAPLSALTIVPELVEAMAGLHVSSTYGGDALSLAICRSVVTFCNTSGYAERMARAGKEIGDVLNAASEDLGLGKIVHGYPALPFFKLSDNNEHSRHRMRILQRHAAAEGVLLRQDLNFVTDGFDEEVTKAAAERLVQALRRSVASF